MFALCFTSLVILTCFSQSDGHQRTFEEIYSLVIYEFLPFVKRRDAPSSLDHQAFFLRRPTSGRNAKYKDASDILLTSARWITDSHNREGGRFLANFKHEHTVVLNDRGLLSIHNHHHVPISNVIIHPAYAGKTDDKHDVAIIKLSRPLTFSTFLQPMEISNRNITDVVDCLLMGWNMRFDYSDMKAYKTISLASARNFTSINGQLRSDVFMVDDDDAFWTSTGAPLICSKGGDMFAHGFVIHQTCRKITFANNEYCEMFGATYVDLYPQYQWIMDTLHVIDTPNVYHSDIASYEFNLCGKALNPALNASHIDLWYSKAIYRKVVIDEGQICVSHSVDDDTVRNAYECTIKCFMRNDGKPCNYVGSLNKCFYSVSNVDNCTLYDAISISFSG